MSTDTVRVRKTHRVSGLPRLRQRARDLVRQHRAQIDHVANLLLERETLTADEIEQAMLRKARR